MPASQCDLVDRSGARLSVVWSRSGKTIGIAVMPQSRGYAQTGLDADQAQELARFLCEGPAPGALIELQDPEIAEARVELAWNQAGTRLTLTLQPATPWEGALPQVEFAPNEVARVADFLARGSPRSR